MTENDRYTSPNSGRTSRGLVDLALAGMLAITLYGPAQAQTAYSDIKGLYPDYCPTVAYRQKVQSNIGYFPTESANCLPNDSDILHHSFIPIAFQLLPYDTRACMCPIGQTPVSNLELKCVKEIPGCVIVQGDTETFPPRPHNLGIEIVKLGIDDGEAVFCLPGDNALGQKFSRTHPKPYPRLEAAHCPSGDTAVSLAFFLCEEYPQAQDCRAPEDSPNYPLRDNLRFQP